MSAVVVGWILALSFAPPASASTRPVITETTASFVIPTGGGVTSWRLRLWSSGSPEGTATGTSGTLSLPVPSVRPCDFQADVTATPAHGAPYYYNGIRATFKSCGPTVTQTLAIDIDQCSSADIPTATEVAGGTVAAVGVDTVSSQPNPLAPKAVDSGSYSLLATAPPGFIFVGCGSASTVVGSGGTSASMSLTVASGGSAAGVFYVVAPPTASGGGVPSPGPGGTTSPGLGPSSNPPSPATPAFLPGHSPTPVSSQMLALTGMALGPPLVTAVGSLGLGLLLVGVSRRRRVPAPIESTSTSARSA